VTAVTEDEWLKAVDVRWLGLGRLIKISPRKQRLCAAAFCRRVGHLLKAAGCRHAIEVAERYADRLATTQDLRAAHARASADHRSTDSFLTMGECARRYATQAVCWATHPNKRHYAASVADSASCGAACAAFEPHLPSTLEHKSTEDWERNNTRHRTAHAGECSAQMHLLREIVGNPFRPVVLDPGCRVAGVTGLAQTAYEERDTASGLLDPARLAVLADALEEAGCGDWDVLTHLRSPGPHVRGCWAVDLVLGLS
jgi:hypothetical protein